MGKANLLAVTLGPELNVWNKENGEASLLMSIIKDNNSISNENDENKNIAFLSWMNNGICLGVGLPNDHIELWDVINGSIIRDIEAIEYCVYHGIIIIYHHALKIEQ